MTSETANQSGSNKYSRISFERPVIYSNTFGHNKEVTSQKNAIFTARKHCAGYVFTRVCQSFHSRGEGLVSQHALQ